MPVLYVERDALAVEGEAVARLDGEVRDAEARDLAHSRVGQCRHGEQAAVEDDGVLVGEPVGRRT